MGKVKIIKLSSNGHTATTASQEAAYHIVGESLDEGLFAFIEPENVVVSNRTELRGRRMNKVTIFAPVAGG